MMGSNLCFKCGQAGHLARDCTTGNQFIIKCFLCNRPGHRASECPNQTQAAANRGRPAQARPPPATARPPNQAQVHALTRSESLDNEAKVITGMAYINANPAIVLFDSGATHSFISCQYVEAHKVPVEDTNTIIHVESPVHRLASISRMCRACPIQLDSQVLEADLILLPMTEFDIILGMDWLSRWDAEINCRQRRVKFLSGPGKEIQIESVGITRPIKLVSALKAAKLLRQQCQAYLVAVEITQEKELNVK